MATAYGIACVVVAVVIVLRVRFLARYVGWRRVWRELRFALKAGSELM